MDKWNIINLEQELGQLLLVKWIDCTCTFRTNFHRSRRLDMTLDNIVDFDGVDTTSLVTSGEDLYRCTVRANVTCTHYVQLKQNATCTLRLFQITCKLLLCAVYFSFKTFLVMFTLVTNKSIIQSVLISKLCFVEISSRTLWEKVTILGQLKCLDFYLFLAVSLLRYIFKVYHKEPTIWRDLSIWNSLVRNKKNLVIITCLIK